MMDWVEDATARWLRVMEASGQDETPVDEAVRVIAELGTPVTKRRPRRRTERDASDLAESELITAISRQLIAAALVSDLLVDDLAAATGRTRQDTLDGLRGSVPPRLRDELLHILRLELSQAGALLQSPGSVGYSGLGSRIEQLLRLAEQQASELIASASTEAPQIAAVASDRTTKPPC